jgi:hypothetical protein
VIGSTDVLADSKEFAEVGGEFRVKTGIPVADDF